MKTICDLIPNYKNKTKQRKHDRRPINKDNSLVYSKNDNKQTYTYKID